jgi:predicted dehydrogenase
VTGSHILVVGGGSVGKRHARNLSSLGCAISCVDPRGDRLEEVQEELQLQNSFTSLGAALADNFDFRGVVIGSPTSLHVEQATAAVERGLPVLVEKPLSTDIDSGRRLADVLTAASGNLLLGYTWRWWPPLLRVRELLDQGRIGNVLHVSFLMSAHLADWHPWERYQDFFMAKRSLGGGALLDESHWIDLMVWFFGMPSELTARVERISRLEIETDDNVDILVRYAEGPRVSIHLDLFGRPHEKSIRFVGEDGTIVWSESPNQIRMSSEMAGGWDIENFTAERNDMFLGVDREFLDVAEGKRAPSCGIDDGLRVLEIIEAARRSSESGRSSTVHA